MIGGTSEEKKTVISKDVGAWEKHTKGIGLKLLQKFGFSGRLGAKENGVSRAIEVVVRPNGVGLGYGDIVEQGQLKVNKQIEAEWKGLEFVDEEAEKKKSTAEKMASNNSWKRGRGKQMPSEKRISADDFINKIMNESSGTDQTEKTVIIDMRQKETRILSDLQNLSESGIPEESLKPKLGQELLHNVNYLVDAEELAVTRSTRGLSHELARRQTFASEVAEVQNVVKSDSERLERLRKIAQILNKVDERLNNTSNAVPLRSAVSILRTLHEKFREEFQLFGLINLLPYIITKVIGASTSAWDAFQDCEQLRDVHEAIAGQGSLVEYFENENELPLARQTRRVLNDLFLSKYMPSIRRAIASSNWDPATDTVTCVHLFGVVSEVMEVSVLDELVEMYLLPKLTSMLNRWRAVVSSAALTAPLSNEEQCTVPAHVWVLAWLPLLSTRLSSLYPDIRRKLTSAFSNWHPRESEAAISVLRPWIDVFDDTSFEQLLLRAVLPRLAQCLREEFTVNPAAQDLAPLSWCLSWASSFCCSPSSSKTHKWNDMRILPRQAVVALLVGEFFPKWLSTLHAWLSSIVANQSQQGLAPLGEVARWYEGWRSALPSYLLEENQIRACFNIGLNMMSKSVQLVNIKEEGAATENPWAEFEGILSAMRLQTYSVLIDQYRQLQKAEKRLEELDGKLSSRGSSSSLGAASYAPAFSNTHSNAASRGAAPLSGHMLTFKSLVEDYTAKHGVDFLPRDGKFHEGKQVWKLGTAQCYMDQNVLFVSLSTLPVAARPAGMPEGSTHWVPMDLEEIVAAAK